MGQDGQCLPLAVSSGKFLHIGLRLGIASEKEDSRLGEGPLQMCIADLGTGRTIGFPCRFGLAFNQTGIGGEVLHPGETSDIVDFVEDDQTDDHADAGDRLEQHKTVIVMDLCMLFDIPFDTGKLIIIEINEFDIHIDTSLGAWIGKPIIDE